MPHQLVPGTVLTTQEAQVLRMLRTGLSNQNTSTRLSIVIPTVKNHVHSDLTRLGIRTRTEAAALHPSVLACRDR